VNQLFMIVCIFLISCNLKLLLINLFQFKIIFFNINAELHYFGHEIGNVAFYSLIDFSFKLLRHIMNGGYKAYVNIWLHKKAEIAFRLFGCLNLFEVRSACRQLQQAAKERTYFNLHFSFKKDLKLFYGFSPTNQVPS